MKQLLIFSLMITFLSTIVYSSNAEVREESNTKELRSIKNVILLEIHFDSCEIELSQNHCDYLDSLVIKMNQYPNVAILIAGFTDNLECLYMTETNKPFRRFAYERASKVANYLINKGVRRMRVAGLGKDRPASSNNSSTGRALNRRVVISRID